MSETVQLEPREKCLPCEFTVPSFAAKLTDYHLLACMDRSLCKHDKVTERRVVGVSRNIVEMVIGRGEGNKRNLMTYCAIHLKLTKVSKGRNKVWDNIGKKWVDCRRRMNLWAVPDGWDGKYVKVQAYVPPCWLDRWKKRGEMIEEYRKANNPEYALLLNHYQYLVPDKDVKFETERKSKETEEQHLQRNQKIAEEYNKDCEAIFKARSEKSTAYRCGRRRMVSVSGDGDVFSVVSRWPKVARLRLKDSLNNLDRSEIDISSAHPAALLRALCDEIPGWTFSQRTLDDYSVNYLDAYGGDKSIKTKFLTSLNEPHHIVQSRPEWKRFEARFPEVARAIVTCKAKNGYLSVGRRCRELVAEQVLATVSLYYARHGMVAYPICDALNLPSIHAEEMAHELAQRCANAWHVQVTVKSDDKLKIVANPK